MLDEDLTIQFLRYTPEENLNPNKILCGGKSEAKAAWDLRNRPQVVASAPREQTRF